MREKNFYKLRIQHILKSLFVLSKNYKLDSVIEKYNIYFMQFVFIGVIAVRHVLGSICTF